MEDMIKCVCGKVHGMDRWVSDYDGRMQKHRVECGCGICGPWRDYETKAIDAWNALPRAPRWVEYDGTEATLPPTMVTVLVHAVHHCDHLGKKLHASGNLFNEAAVPIWWIDGKGFVRLEIGDRWLPWPEGGE